MRNIPERVDPNDPDAPWNQNHPTPDDWCPHCGRGLVSHERYGNLRHIVVDDIDGHALKTVRQGRCPDCREVMWATLLDETGMYLEAWRSHPHEMAHTIDSYESLRRFD